MWMLVVCLVTLLMGVISGGFLGASGGLYILANLKGQQRLLPNETRSDRALMATMARRERQLLCLMKGIEWDVMRERIHYVRKTLLPELLTRRRALERDLTPLAALIRETLHDNVGFRVRAQGRMASLKRAMKSVEEQISNAEAFMDLCEFEIRTMRHLESDATPLMPMTRTEEPTPLKGQNRDIDLTRPLEGSSEHLLQLLDEGILEVRVLNEARLQLDQLHRTP